jgi:site-specific DNA recombinase
MTLTRTRRTRRPASPDPATALRAGVYDRVSLDKKRDNRSGQQQFGAISAACALLGWVIVQRYSDPNVSASRFSDQVRKNWEKLLADLKAGQFDVLVLWESSRGDRKAPEWLALLALCRQHNVLIHVIEDRRTYDMTIRRDWKNLAEDGIDNADDSEKTSGRVRRDMDDAARAGKPHGIVAYGYERVYHPKTRTLIEQRIVPDQAAVVKEIIRRVSEAVPVITIQADLNRRGIPAPNGGQWTRGSVRRVATNPVYIARRYYYEETLPVNCPAIVDEVSFFGAQRVLSDPQRTTTRPGSQKWLLSYLAKCGACGSVMQTRQCRTRSSRYQCQERYCAAIEVTWLDNLVTRLVINYMATPQPYRKLAQANDEAMLEARAEVERLVSEQDEYKALGKAGKMKPAVVAEMVAALEGQQAAAEQRVERAASLPTVAWQLADAANPEDAEDQRVRDVRARWDCYEVATQREIVKALFEVTIRPAKQGRHGVTLVDRADRVDVAWHVE